MSMSKAACINFHSEPAIIAGKKFRKDIMRVGKFYNHTESGEEVTYDVTPERLQNWVTQFEAMKKAGVKVPVPTGHNSDTAGNNGWVDKLEVDGDRLVAEMSIADDKKDIVQRADVSIFAPEEVVDGEGNVYPGAISHVAMVSEPLVSKLGDFQPIAASRIPVYSTNSSSQILAELNSKVIEKDAVIAELKKLDNERSKINVEITAKLELSHKELEGIKAQLQKSQEELVAERQVVPENEKEMKAQLLAIDTERLLKAGRIDPKSKNKLDILMKDLICYRRNYSIVEKVIAILNANIPVQFGQRTGKQGVSPVSHMPSEDPVGEAMTRMSKK
jgi:hypothetical protein